MPFNTFTKYSFVERIRNVKASNTLFAYFDVKIRFSNVPLREVSIRDVYTDKLYKLTKTSLSKENFVNLLKTGTCNVRFSFKSDIVYTTSRCGYGITSGAYPSQYFYGFFRI